MGAYLNPYRFRLWLDSLGGYILNARQKRLLLWLLAWGKKGCDSYNYRLAKEMQGSIRTIRRDLRRLERYHLINITGALGKHRRIIVLPYKNKAVWKSHSFTNMCQKVGDKFVPHQRRLNIRYLNIAQKQRDQLLYDTKKKAEPEKTSGRVLPQGETPRTPPAVQGSDERVLEIARRGLIDMFLHMGWPRERAIAIAEAKIIKLKEQRT